MKEEYLADYEYEDYFPRLNDLRHRVAKDMPLGTENNILDIATGYGYFALELLKIDKSLNVIGIDISKDSVKAAYKNVEKNNLTNSIKIIEMDATEMNFDDDSFDMVVNFLGLEDIHMTRGKIGIGRTFSEAHRVLKPNGYFCFVAMPPDEMETEAQKIEVALFSNVCNATWLSAGEYETMLKKTGFELISKSEYYTGRKLTSEQARIEIDFACKNIPRIYGIKTPTFNEIWKRFGNRIEKHGLGHYSKVVLFIARKLGAVHQD